MLIGQYYRDRFDLIKHELILIEQMKRVEGMKR
jgi:hypothetical protein